MIIIEIVLINRDRSDLVKVANIFLRLSRDWRETRNLLKPVRGRTEIELFFIYLFIYSFIHISFAGFPRYQIPGIARLNRHR